MTLKDRYGFGGFSGTPPSEPNLSTPPPPPGGHQGVGGGYRLPYELFGNLGA